MMGRTDRILKSLLRVIAERDGHSDLKKAADYIVDHDWDEVVGIRAAFFVELGDLLRQDPLDLEAIRRSIQQKGSTILGGHSSLRAQVNDFLQSSEAEGLIQGLVGDRSKPPDAQTIESFIDAAVRLAFHTKSGGGPRRSEAALFASVLLTSVFPDDFCDFRQSRWGRLAEAFELEPAPSGAGYGEMLLWAGRAAKQFAGTRTFRRYFEVDTPNWVAGGLTFLLHDDEMQDLLHEAKERIPPPPEGDGMKITAQDVWQILEQHNPQVILQGPPGSGKTFLAERVVEFLADFAELEPYRLGTYQEHPVPQDYPVLWDIVQFHPSYGYEDFVRGLSTVPTEGGIVFQAQDRILAEAAGAALEHPETPVILILDEVNRADLARVLGELIYVLERERRGMPVSSQYAVGDPPDRTLILPPNLYLIGTMNTADRSIALVDYAIRRRFSFVSVLPRVEVIEAFYRDQEAHGGKAEIAERLGPKVVALYQPIYDLFDELQDADDIRIGHSYFLVKGNRRGQSLSLEEWADAIGFRFAYEVAPMLAEYRKERRLRDGSDRINVEGSEFFLRLDEQGQIRSTVKDWLMQE